MKTGVYVLTGHGVGPRAQLRSDAAGTPNLPAAADWILGHSADTAPHRFSKRRQTTQEAG
jgi:hypothetical protein